MIIAFLKGILEFFCANVLPVIAPIIVHEYALRRESDPEFKALSDQTYNAVKTAQTTADRQAASRKLYELQKGIKSPS